MNPLLPKRPDERIDRLINEYFDRKQSGEEITPSSFAAEYPDLADELLPYLDGLSFMDRVCPLGGDAADRAGGGASQASLPLVPGYRLLEEVARGGMGVVYKAIQLSTKRIVALKVMSAGTLALSSARRRFDREVEYGARLQHANIVRVLESGRVAGQRYYAMDFVQGVRLDQHLSTGQPNVHTVLHIFSRICEAVEYAHGRGVVHRDLKPSNVLIDDNGEPHVLDFGLGKATDHAGREEASGTSVSVLGQILGTLFYLSPEQAAGEPDGIDARTDVYALGVMLFEALTGSLPFDTAGLPSDVLHRILDAPPARPSALSNRVDGEIETVVLKALEKEKARRYQSARDLADDIRRYVTGDPILAKRTSRLYIFRKKAMKHRWAVMIGVVVVALTLGGLATKMRSRHRVLTEARRQTLFNQSYVERGNARGALTTSVALYEECGERLPETTLVHAQARYWIEETRAAAVQLLEGAVQRRPSLWACRLLLADIYLGGGDAQRARALRAQAQLEAPDTAEAWYLRSFATLDRKKALRCTEEAVKRRSSHVLAWMRLTWLCQLTGDLDGALRAVDKVIELDDRFPHARGFRAYLLALQGRFQEALEEYDRLCGSSACLDRAHAYRYVREYEKSVEEYTRKVAVQAEATSAWILYQRATPLWILGRTDEALDDYRRVRLVLGYPTCGDARRFLILRELGRVPEADEVLGAVLRDVEDPSWLRQIFRCLDGQLTPDELVADARARNNLEQLCEAYYYAAEACLLSGNRDNARKWFEHGVQTNLRFDPDASTATPMNEYELARWRLDTLFADTSTSPAKEN